MLKRRYTYTVLRYIHDPLTSEFVNVGIVVHFPASSSGPAVLKVGTTNRVGRFRPMFPNLSRTAFTTTMRTMDKMLSRLANQIGADELFASGDASAFASKVLPADDSSLQWSPVGSGVAVDPEQVYQRLFERLITKYDDKPIQRRSDEEVWRPVRQMLEDRNISVDLEPKTISSGDDRIHFQHAWKNGEWHVYEAISLDLSDEDGIYQKVHRWLGRLTSVVPCATEAFRPYFYVGAPSDPALDPAYDRAIKILRKSPGPIEVFPESELDLMVNRIEDAVKAHNSAH